jgi:hypothetical protein
MRIRITGTNGYLTQYTYVYNTIIHSAAGYTPFELGYGFQSTLPSNLHETPSTQYSNDVYVLELRSGLQTAHDIARQKLIAAKEKSKEYYDKNSEEFRLKVDDKVLL